MSDEMQNTPNTSGDSENAPGGASWREEMEARVYKGLRQVIDPEIGLNVVELGLVRELDIHEDRVHLVMIMTTPFCPYAPQLLEASRGMAQQASGLPTTIEVGMEMWDPSMAEDGVLSDWGLF
ncbi:MAG: DUF59 domain-containing protein [Chloroflexi bacterium]|jgi:metal-sulfur cluster biosynthetic enzyme|nr:DUF59 domain-containing protein [Chloroflexota bacterium]